MDCYKHDDKALLPTAPVAHYPDCAITQARALLAKLAAL